MLTLPQAALLDAQGVAEMLGEPVRQVRERITKLPGFPTPFRFGGKGHRKWRADEVWRWVEQQRQVA